MTPPMAENCLVCLHSPGPRDALRDFDASGWVTAPRVRVDREWSGRRLPPRLHGVGGFTVAARWTAEALHFLFDCRFNHLDVNTAWGLDGPVDRLWEFDVVEVFLRSPHNPEYVEVEVSPLGQWLDLKVRVPRRDVDWSWRSGLWRSVSVDPDNRRWLTLLELPWDRLEEVAGSDLPPALGDAWRANFLRCARDGGNRLYLAWRPTFTQEPDFHVPHAFGHLVFLDREPLP